MTHDDQASITIPSAQADLPEWPDDLPPELCRFIADDDDVIINGRMIPEIREQMRVQSKDTAFWSSCVLTPLETDWDALRIKRSDAVPVADRLISLARSKMAAIQGIETTQAYLSVAALVMAINYLAEVIFPCDPETGNPIQPENPQKDSFAFVRISGPYISLAVSENPKLLLATLTNNAVSFACNPSNSRYWNMSDTVPIDDIGGTEIIFDISEMAVNENSENTPPFVLSVLLKTANVLAQHILTEPSSHDDRHCPSMTNPFIQICPPTRSSYVIAAMNAEETDDDKQYSVSLESLPVILKARDATIASLLLQHVATLLPYHPAIDSWSSNTSFNFFDCRPHEMGITVAASDLPKIIDALSHDIIKLEQINSRVSLINSLINFHGMASIHYDTATNIISLSGLLVACERASIISLAQDYRLTHIMSLSEDGNGYDFATEPLSDIGRWTKTLDAFLKQVSDLFSNGPNHVRYSLSGFRIPVALLDMEQQGIIKVKRFPNNDWIISIRINDQDLCRRVRNDLIALGWGWQTQNNRLPSDDTRLLIPHDAMFEYLINTAMPRSNLILSQTKQIILGQMTDTLSKPEDFLHFKQPARETVESANGSDTDNEYEVSTRKETASVGRIPARSTKIQMTIIFLLFTVLAGILLAIGIKLLHIPHESQIALIGAFMVAWVIQMIPICFFAIKSDNG